MDILECMHFAGVVSDVRLKKMMCFCSMYCQNPMQLRAGGFLIFSMECFKNVNNPSLNYIFVFIFSHYTFQYSNTKTRFLPIFNLVHFTEPDLLFEKSYITHKKKVSAFGSRIAFIFFNFTTSKKTQLFALLQSLCVGFETILGRCDYSRVWNWLKFNEITIIFVKKKIHIFIHINESFGYYFMDLQNARPNVI